MEQQNCARCNGTGRKTFGAREIECGMCNGTGKVQGGGASGGDAAAPRPGGISSLKRTLGN